MKYIERNFYRCRLIRYPFPIDVWFALKDRYFGGAHAGEGRKFRHRRSIRCVRMMALFGDKDNSRFTRIGKEIGRCKHGKWLYMPKRVRLEVDSPANKAHRTGRRLSWRKGGAK